ncbi:hypothetical protein [Sphingomicrobium flavum]|uniref:hypothetical protein n=1 Tax=Sphingomicrobium flavum TaxID=1229164 RepID=UPI0021ADB216|nr:hypothetical protein [Sphingomicrobium flavum]
MAQPVPDAIPPEATTDPQPEAPAVTEPVAPEEAPVIVTGEREKVVCRREKPTGSRVATKICRTEQSLREEQLATQEVMTELQLAGGPPVENHDASSGIIGPKANPF